MNKDKYEKDSVVDFDEIYQRSAAGWYVCSAKRKRYLKSISKKKKFYKYIEYFFLVIYLLSVQGCFKIGRLFRLFFQRTVKQDDISSMRPPLRSKAK